MSPLKILIADDHEVFRRRLRSLIETRPDWRICAEASDGIDAIAKAKQWRPNIVLMDVSMPRMDGMEASRIIRREVPASEVIIVSQNDPNVVSRLSAEAGASAYIAKSNVALELFPAIEEVIHSNGNKKHTAPVGDSRLISPAWVLGGGEMGERMRSLDWSQTPLGPIPQWPQSLKTSVSICLASRFPIVMYWGPEYVVLYNDAYRTILGSKHPWALGQRCRDCWAEIWDTIGPMLDGVVSSAQATWSDDLLLLLRRHGYAEECYFSFSFSPIRIENGDVGGVFTAVMETTDKVIGERRLRTLRDLAARAVDATSEPDAWRIAAATLGENLHDVPFSVLCKLRESNNQVVVLETAGIDSAHPFCKSLCTAGSSPFAGLMRVAKSRQLIELSDLQQWAHELPTGAWQTPPQTALLLPVADLGPERAVLLAAVSPHKALNESYRTFFQLVAHQIANSVGDARSHEEERKRAEALAELDRAKTLFFSNVSHEFRTPLTLMLGPLEDVLAASNGLAPEQRQRLEVAHRNALRLLKLVNTLLDFSRIEAGRIQASFEPVDLAKLTAELASVFRSAIERAGLRLLIDCPPLAEPVYVDREMWEKIVLNLLSNAFKFTFEGEVSVSLRQAGSAVEMTVRDTGTGIPADELPRLFERFHRVKGARGRSYEGSGIGLALVQELVKLHSGSVRVQSEVDHGTTLAVAIPLGKEHLPAERIGAARSLAATGLGGEAYVEEAVRWLPEGEVSSAPHSASVTDRPMPGERPACILLADDNADMRDYVQRLLRERYEVFTAADGEAALKTARERRPDLILSDVMMPRMDGFELLRAVRSDPDLKSVPVILLSARAGEESRVEGLDAGANDYLVKPFSARELMSRVNSHLAMTRIRLELEERERDLRLNAEKLAAIVASSDDAIIGKSLDGTITSWNESAERLFGYTAEEAVGKHITLIIPRDRWKEEEIILSKLRQGKRVEPFETVRVRKDGATVELSLTISPIKDPSGRVIGASKVARDISERKRAERALRDSEERFRRMSESLDAEVRLRTSELRELSWRLLRTQDEERRRIARELHDSAGQTLTVLGMSLAQLVQKSGRKAPELATDAEAIQETIQQLHREIRTTSYLLHPPLLDEAGLSSALGWYVQGLNERSGLNLSLDIAQDLGRLPAEMELAVFRIVQECLTNIHRHSESKTAAIRIEREGDVLTLDIRDHGKGMSAARLAEIQSQGSGVGIRGMRERLRQFEGSLNIESDSSGTRVLVTIPVAQPLSTASGPVEAAVQRDGAICSEIRTDTHLPSHHEEAGSRPFHPSRARAFRH